MGHVKAKNVRGSNAKVLSSEENAVVGVSQGCRLQESRLLTKRDGRRHLDMHGEEAKTSRHSSSKKLKNLLFDRMPPTPMQLLPGTRLAFGGPLVMEKWEAVTGSEPPNQAFAQGPLGGGTG